MALVGFNEDTGNPEYQYINISKYKMWNVSSVNQFKKNNLTANLGASIIGVSQKSKIRSSLQMISFCILLI